MQEKILCQKIYAAILPVHAPVTGKGIITNSMSPSASYFFTSAPFRLVLAKSHSKNFLKKGILESRSSPYLRIRRMRGIGRKLPKNPK